MNDNNLKYCREELEMTQKELGFVFGVSDKTIANWENSYDTIPLPKLVKFCNLYNYSIDYILGLDKRNKSTNKKIILNKSDIGNNLRKVRKDNKLTQKEIADKCSVSRTTFTYYELGKNLITTRTLYIFCKNFNISAYDLFTSKKN